MNKAKLWTKDFLIVSGINFFVTLIFYLLMVTISTYAVEKFDANTSEAGLVTGIFVIGALLGRLFAGRIIDQIGRKKILFLGLILFAVTTLLYFVANTLFLLLINRLLHGIALGIASTATGTIVAQIIPSTRRGEGIGYYSLSAIIATAIGPFFGMYLKEHASYQIIFLFCLILGAFSLVTALFLKVPSIQVSNNVAREIKGFKMSNFIEKKAIPISVVTFFVGFAYSGVLSFITFYAKELKLVEAASFFFAIYAIMVLVSRPLTGRLFDVKGANLVIYPALSVFAAGMFLLSQVEQGWTLLVAGAIIGLGYGNYTSSAQAVSVKVTPPQRLGLATSTFFIFVDLGFGIGPYILGFFVPYTGFRGLYMIMVGVILFSMVLYYFLHGKKERQLNKTNTVLLREI
ncbi:MFS transporter [Bacillus sp. 1NLA3E]|uniref:MFS transporter n=1 Tax=Bacillus sp. 1NLA3E TaxID=666686 RepID=UPI000247E407|nr:MFS transporter [Bacillus sp. 1NLA3E]AGK52299.1 major facilitator superfamily protein [Bacillus sp. 1NLA3E]